MKHWLSYIIPGFIIIDAPMTCLPQILRMIHTHSSNDVSLLTWLLCGITSTVWAVRAKQDKSKVLTIGCGLWAIMDFGVVIYAWPLR